MLTMVVPKNIGKPQKELTHQIFSNPALCNVQTLRVVGVLWGTVPVGEFPEMP